MSAYDYQGGFMPAPLGNKFWKARTTYGRDKLFTTKEMLWAAASQYFDWAHENPLEEAVVYQGEVSTKSKPLMRAMTIDGLCIYLDIDQDTLLNYESKEGYEDFFGVVKRIKAIIRTQKFEGASAGLLNPSIIARDLGLSDKTENLNVDLTHEQWLDGLK
jgi:hypothetical protein